MQYAYLVIFKCIKFLLINKTNVYSIEILTSLDYRYIHWSAIRWNQVGKTNKVGNQYAVQYRYHCNLIARC